MLRVINEFRRAVRGGRGERDGIYIAEGKRISAGPRKTPLSDEKSNLPAISKTKCLEHTHIYTQQSA